MQTFTIARDSSAAEGARGWEVPLGDLRLSGDVNVVMTCSKSGFALKQSEEKLCSFWFHTSFIDGERVSFMKAELDGPPKKDKKGDRFRDSFGVSISFTTEMQSEDFRIHHPDSGISGSYTPADIVYHKEGSTYVVPAKGGDEKPGSDPFIRLASNERAGAGSAQTADAPPGVLGQEGEAKIEDHGAGGASVSASDCAHPIVERSPSDLTVTEDVIGEAVMIYDFEPSLGE